LIGNARGVWVMAGAVHGSAVQAEASPSWGAVGSLDGIFHPKTIAIVGSWGAEGSLGQRIAASLVRSEFQGTMCLVQREITSISGTPVYPRLQDVPGKLDLVVAVCQPEEAPGILEQCVEKNVKGVILISSGFGANGEDRAAAVRQMREILHESRTRVIGPNSLGVMNPQIGLNATPGLQMPLGGTVAFLGESPILSRTVLDWSLKHIVGFSCFASLGQMLDISWANLIDYFGRDPYTRAIVVQISSIRDARSFISAAREVSLDKPIIAIKTGRSEAAIRAFTWRSRSVLNDDDVLAAAFHRVGVVQVDTLEDLFYAADAISKQPRPRGPRLMVVSNADGAGVLAADAVAQAGVEIAQPSAETREKLGPVWNSVDRLEDAVGDGSAESYVGAIELADKDPNCDGLLAVMVPWGLQDPAKMAELILESRSRAVKPLLVTYMGTAETAAAQETLLRACVPTFTSPGAAARVFQYMWRYSYDLQALYETPVLDTQVESLSRRESVRALIERVRVEGRTELTDDECRTVLGGYGIRIAPGEAAETNVLLRAKIGSRVDPQFGPVLMFGAADRGADTYGGLVVGLPPLNATLARRMLERSEFYRAVQRSATPEASLAMQELLVRFSEMATEQPSIQTIEIEPLMVGSNGIVAGGCRAELHPADIDEAQLPRPAIRPYPAQYVYSWTMKNGEDIIIRPIRAADEPLMVNFHQGLSDRSIYLRYFQRVKLSTRTKHERLVRVCFLDYDREMALLAERRDPETQERSIIAIGTLSKIALKNEGEVAVLIADACQAQGLGTELIARLVQFARDEGLRRVVASTMNENKGMCAVFRKLGFDLRDDLEEKTVEIKLEL
ncbi:MAG TPA: GNAT family N-acetyltransferase, partial [Terriglobales bacterium]|nr:GNAT family N-acetyltransferase [Terriglobales bacterium]